MQKKVHAKFQPAISGVYELTPNVILWIDGKKLLFLSWAVDICEQQGTRPSGG